MMLMMMSATQGDQNAPAAPASKGIFGIDTRTCVDGGQPDNGQGSIKATLGKVKHEIMGTNPGDNMGKE